MTRPAIHARSTVERVLELRKTHSIKETARIMRISERSVTRAQAQGGRKAPPKRSPATAEQYAAAVQLLEEGAGYAEAARSTGVDRWQLRRKYPGMGMSTADKVAYASFMRRNAKVLDNLAIKTVD